MTSTQYPTNFTATFKPYKLFSGITCIYASEPGVDGWQGNQKNSYRCIGSHSVKRKMGKPLFKSGEG